MRSWNRCLDFSITFSLGNPRIEAAKMKMKCIWITWHCNKVLKHISCSPLSINLNQYHWERNLCHRGILKCQTLWYSFMGASDTLSLGIHFYEGKLCVVEELIRFIGRKYLLKWDKTLMDLCNFLGKLILFHGFDFVQWEQNMQGSTNLRADSSLSGRSQSVPKRSMLFRTQFTNKSGENFAWNTNTC